MKNRYFNLIDRIYLLQKKFGFRLIKIGKFSFNVDYPVFKIEFGKGGKEVLIFTGIHGDEPAGPEAILRFIPIVYKDKELLDKFSFTIFPCDNPQGYAKNKRENYNGLDLNREFKNTNPPKEIKFIKRALRKKQFDIALGMHEDRDSKGFYLYEPPTKINLFGDKIINTIKKSGFPVEANYVDNDSSIGQGNQIQIKNGLVIFPKRKKFEKNVAKMKYWPAAVYLIKRHTKKELTFETPLNIELNKRIKMHLLAIDTSLNFLIKN